MTAKALRCLSALVPTALLSGCQDYVVLFPAGYVAEQQRDMLVASVVLMLLIIIPLFVAIIVIAWRYRDTNPKSAYAPEWEHSVKLELLIWAAPLAIIIALGAMTWIGTHKLDPYSPLARIDDQIPLQPDQVQALRVDVVAFNWGWLFLYPQYDIATIGELAAPVDVPIKFRITATDVMNSFYIPTLAGQIYAMPGMQTRLNAVINEVGVYQGISANYSGHGFNGMDFRFIGMTHEKFMQWIESIQSGDGQLSEDRFRKVAHHNVDPRIRYFSEYGNELFRQVVLECIQEGATCRPKGLPLVAMCRPNFTPSPLPQKSIE